MKPTPKPPQPRCKRCGVEHLSIRKGKLVFLDKDGLCWFCQRPATDEREG
jgi:hypothetical protein